MVCLGGFVGCKVKGNGEPEMTGWRLRLLRGEDAGEQKRERE